MITGVATQLHELRTERDTLASEQPQHQALHTTIKDPSDPQHHTLTAEVAGGVAQYCPHWWPATTRLLIRRVRLAPPEQLSADPVGAELVIHDGDLGHRWMVAVRHDRRSWRYDCSI